MSGLTKEKLDKVRALVSEHFEEFLIVVEDGDRKIWSTCSSKTAAFGMTELIRQNIKTDWNEQHQSIEE